MFWFFFFSSRRRHTRWNCDWSSDVCSSDLEPFDIADPRMDFVELTIVRLGLSGQRREVAEATRWLDDDDRELLALWWLEAGGAALSGAAHAHGRVGRSTVAVVAQAVRTAHPRMPRLLGLRRRPGPGRA